MKRSRAWWIAAVVIATHAYMFVAGILIRLAVTRTQYERDAVNSATNWRDQAVKVWWAPVEWISGTRVSLYSFLLAALLVGLVAVGLLWVATQVWSRGHRHT